MQTERMTEMRVLTTLLRARAWVRLLAIVLLALTALSATAPGAGAAGNGRAQECTGTLEGGVVDGTLVVPAGASCELIGTRVRGDVRLAGGGDNFANLSAEGARIDGDLQIGEQSIASLDDTRVGGNVEARGTWAVLDASGGSIGGRVRMADAERINLGNITVNGDVRFERSRLIVAHGAQIKGTFRAADVEFAAIVESRVGGNVAIDRATNEARLCNSRIAGQATLQDNPGKVTIGGGNPALRCGGSKFDGNLRIFENTGGVTIEGNTVRDNLACRDNDPAPTGGNNRVEGRKQGQCDGL